MAFETNSSTFLYSDITKFNLERLGIGSTSFNNGFQYTGSKPRSIRNIKGETPEDESTSTEGLSQEQMSAMAKTAWGAFDTGMNIWNKVNPLEENKTRDGVYGGLDMAELALGKYGFAAKAAKGILQLGDLAFSKHYDKWTVDKNLQAKQGASYGGAFDFMQDYSDRTGKTYGGIFGGQGDMKGDNRKSRMMASTISSINKELQDYKDRDNPYKYILRNVAMSGNVQPTMFSKLGGRIERIKNLKKEITVDEVDKFQKGGKVNLIPEGALHARKNNLEVEGITHKGIPVISLEEGGEILQHAEIECNEIIFRLSVTELLEDLRKNYKESGDDTYAIEAGKLLTQEILYNTDDRTLLLEQ